MPAHQSSGRYETDGFVFRINAPEGIPFKLQFRDGVFVFCIIASFGTGLFFHFGEISNPFLCVVALTCVTCVQGLVVSHLGFGYEQVVHLRPTFLMLMYLPINVWAFVSYGLAETIWMTTTLPQIIWVAVDGNIRYWELAFMGTAMFFVVLCSMMVQAFFEGIYESDPERCIKR